MATRFDYTKIQDVSADLPDTTVILTAEQVAFLLACIDDKSKYRGVWLVDGEKPSDDKWDDIEGFVDGTIEALMTVHDEDKPSLRIDHDTGDLSEYDQLVIPANLSAVAGGLDGSSHSMQVTLGGSVKPYGRIWVKRWAMEFWLDTNSINMANGNDFTVCHAGDGGGKRADIELKYLLGNYRIYVEVVDDDGFDVVSNEHIITDGLHHIRLDVYRSDDDDEGEIKLTIDGEEKQVITGDLNDFALPDNIRFGAYASVDSGTNGTFFVDGLKLFYYMD